MGASRPLRHGASTRRNSNKNMRLCHTTFMVAADFSHGQRGLSIASGAACPLSAEGCSCPERVRTPGQAGRCRHSRSHVHSGRGARGPLPAAGSNLELKYSGCARDGGASGTPASGDPPKPPSGRENPSTRVRRGSHAVHARVHGVSFFPLPTAVRQRAHLRGR